MLDVNKLNKIAKKFGVEVNPKNLDHKTGIYYRNSENELVEWNVIQEFKLNNSSNYLNNFFDKDFYVNKINKNINSPYVNDKKENSTILSKQYFNKTLISEAA
ncbi:hypothetical protein [Staphylococcus hominis]